MSSQLYQCSADPSHEVGKYTFNPKFCSECGAPVVPKLKCPCGALLTGKEQYCEACGKRVLHRQDGGHEVGVAAASAAVKKVTASHTDWQRGEEDGA